MKVKVVEHSEFPPQEPMAIVGMACRFPGSRSISEFWRQLMAGENAVIQGPPGSVIGRAGRLYPESEESSEALRYGAFIDDLDQFDAEFFRISPLEAQMLDPQQRLMLDTSWQALEDAAIDPAGLRGSRTGIYAGISNTDYRDMVINTPESVDATAGFYAVTGTALNTAIGRVSFALGLEGPSMAIDTACSSSLVAIHQAASALERREADVALAGGVHVFLAGRPLELRASSGMLSPTGQCWTFDEAADGFVCGEGCGLVVLKRLSDAEAAGDRIWAVLRGSAVNQDGASQGLTVPSGPSQERAMLEALGRAGIAPGDADYLEAHGTGTVVGDPIELSAAASVYGRGRSPERPVLVGSVKTNIGHLGPAAGAAGLIKAVLAMRHGRIPRHLNFRRPSPQVDWDGLPVRVTDDVTDWPANGDKPPVAGVNSFGWSGTNAHIVVSGYGAPDAGASNGAMSAPAGPARKVAASAGPPPEGAHIDGPADAPADAPVGTPASPARETRLLALSGRSPQAVEDSAAAYLRWLDEHGPELASAPAAAGSALSDMAWTAATGRSHFDHRAGVVFSDAAQLRTELEELAGGRGIDGSGAPRRAAKTAFAFTGQASQWAGMGAALYEAEPVFRSVLDRCAAELARQRETSLLDVMFGRGGTGSLLDDPAWTQPAIYSLQCALVALWASVGITPSVVVGHSLGEIAAAQAAGALTLSQGLRYAAARGTLMGATRSDGAMAAVFAPAERVEEAVVAHNAASTDMGVSVAVDNGIQQVVSGPAADVDALLSSFESADIKTVRLRPSPAYHSALVESALDDLSAAFAQIAPDPPPTSVPLVSNLSGRVLGPDERMDAGYWRRHARAPVAFRSCVETLAEMGVDAVVEIGPHAVLGPLVSMIWPQSPSSAAPAVVQSLLRPPAGASTPAADASGGFVAAVAGAYEAGLGIDFAGLFAGEARRRVAVPGYPFQRIHHWVQTSGRRRRDAGHALLGTRHESPRGEVAFETEMFPSDPAWMPDHLVYERIVAPGGMFGAMAVSAALADSDGPVAVDDMQMHSALVFDDEDPDGDPDDDLGSSGRRLQVVIDGTPDEPSRPFEIFSKGDAERGWTLHAQGRLSSGTAHELLAPTDVATADLDALRAELAPQSTADFYRMRSADNIYLGPSYHTLQAVWADAGEALGELALPDFVDAAGMELHPLLLDGCFQVLSVARHLTGMEHDAVYMPFGWDRLWVTGPLPEQVTCHALVRNPVRPGDADTDAAAPPEVVTGDVRFYAPDGTPVGSLDGFTVKRATRTALLASGEGLKNLLYEVDWREQPSDGRLQPAGFLATGAETVAEVQPFADQLADLGVEVTERASLLDGLERLAQAYALTALERLGWHRVAGVTVSAEDLRLELGAADEHQRLFGRLLALLAEAGVLSRRNDAFAVEVASGDPLPDDALADPDALAMQLAEDHPGGVNEIGLLRRCGTALADVLTGSVDPLSLLFSDEGTSAADLYLTAPAARAANRMLGEAVSAAVAGLPDARRLRVLEVGAGTGSATEAILPVLPPERFEYTYTDISASFFAQAEARLATTGASIAYRPLNIESDPVAQGFDAHGYDIVVAANVLHATADLAQTLSHCRSLLAPGGQLIALEGLRRRAWQDLTFGLLDGWWRFADVYRPDHALATAPVWRQALADAGFSDVEFPGTPDADTGDPLGSSVIVARGPAEVMPTPGAWVLAADEDGRAEQLAEELAAHGQTVLLARSSGAPAEAPEPSSGVVEAPIVEVPVDAASREAWKHLLEGLPADLPFRGAVHLMALDGHGPEASTEEMAADVERAAESALAFVQGIIDSDAQPTGGVWFVTSGAQILEEDLIGRTAGQLAGATLWGFGKVMDMEESNLRPRLIDLEAEPKAQGDSATDGLVDELLFGDAETHVAHRAGRRYAARLVRSGAGTHRLDLPEESEWVIGPDDPPDSPSGGLDALAVKPTPRRALEPGEVRIGVEAMGLNYADLLLSMGAVPYDTDAEVGREVSGRVIETGPDVGGLSAGEPVVGVGFGGFAPEMVTRAELTAPVADGFDASAAATVPTGFVTAELAFRLAGLQAGERVLIHAASGGVGLAAIQLAHSMGAEVLATASAPKQAYVRSLGVTHVFDSRRTDFGQEILHATGGEGVHVVLNSLTGEGFIEASLSCLGADGRFVEIGKRGIWSSDEMSAARPDVAYAVLDVDRLKRVEPEIPGAALRDVMARLSSGSVAPLPRTVWPLAEIRSAMGVMRDARHIGKNVLRMPPLARGALRADRTFLVAGGLGGIGCETACWLAANGARTIVLNGRRAPDPEAEDAIAELRSDGVDVRVELADMTDPAAIDGMLARIRETLPPLGGVVHSVGVLADGVIANQTWDQFEQVLWPKVLGAWHLHRATAADDLDMFVLFSSVTGVVGNPGQANHAAANAFLDQLAAHRRARGLVGQSIAWGAWSGIGEAEEHRERIEQQLAYTGSGWITPQQGTEALDRLVRHDVTAPVVTAVDWAVAASHMETPAPFFDDLVAEASNRGRRPDRAAPADPLLGRLRDLPAAERHGPLVAFIQQELSAVMRLASPPSPTVSFFDLGMDSLMAVELRNRLNRALAGEIAVSNTAVFDYPDAAGLAAHLAAEFDDTAAPTAHPERRAPAARKRAAAADERIAIVGMACRLPGAPDIDAFWQMLEDGADAVSDGRSGAGSWAGVLGDPDAADPVLRRGGFVEGIDLFDAKFFRIAPIEARTMDPAQRMLLETSWHALEDAGIDPDGLKGSLTGVYAGVGGSEYRELISSRGQIYSYIGTNPAVTVGRVAFALGLGGPAMPIDMACASSLAAVHQAVAGLQRGEIDMALAGGVNATLSAGITSFLRDMGMLSAGGRCRAFDAGADGFVRAEGCGMLVLKRLSDAEADGDRIWGVVMGSAVNQNGTSAGLLAPNGPAQERVMSEALARAGVAPGDVDYLEAHGVGSEFGDPIELNAVASVFGRDRDAERPLLVGSVKTNIGHTEWASGAASLIKAVLMMRRKTIPATLNFSDPSPHVDWERLPVQVVSQPTRWPAASGRPPVASVNSFGMSGTNAHVVVGGYSNASADGEASAPVGPAMPVGAVTPDGPAVLNGAAMTLDAARPAPGEFAERTTRLLPLSGKSPAALRALARRYAEMLDRDAELLHRAPESSRDAPSPEPDAASSAIADMAWTAAAGRSHFRCRAGLVFDDAAQLRAGIEELARGDESADDAEPPEASRAAFAFAEADDRLVSMARYLYRTEPVVRQVLDDCSATAVELGTGSLLDQILGSGAGAADGRPAAPVVTFAAQCALGALWKSLGVDPSVVIAAGLGKMAAAQAADVLSLSQGVRTLAALGASSATPTAPDSEALLTDLSEALGGIDASAPSVTMVCAETGEAFGPGEAPGSRWWRPAASALAAPDPAETVGPAEALYRLSVDAVIEIGSGPGIGARVLERWPTPVSDDTPPRPPALIASLQPRPGAPAAGTDGAAFVEAVARAYEAGFSISATGLFAGEARRRVPLPGYPFQRIRHWVDAPKTA